MSLPKRIDVIHLHGYYDIPSTSSLLTPYVRYLQTLGLWNIGRDYLDLRKS